MVSNKEHTAYNQDLKEIKNATFKCLKQVTNIVREAVTEGVITTKTHPNIHEYLGIDKVY